MEELALLARLVLAGVFVVSAVAKLRDRESARVAVADFGLPQALVPLIAAALPFAELGCALLVLCSDPFATAGALASLVLLAAFTVTVAVNLVSGKSVDCHCFGQLSGGATSWRTVARNGLLMVVAALPLARAGELASVPGMADDYAGERVALAALLAALTAAVIVLSLLFQTLMKRYGGVLLRLETLETMAGIAPAKEAPELVLPDLDGDVVDLADVLADGRPALLAFIAPSCLHCSELLPDLAEWQADADHPLSVLVVSSGTAADNREKIAEHPALRILLQDGRSTELAYGLSGTPAAVVVTADGRLAGPPGYAVEGVRQLHDNVVRNLTAQHDHALHQIGPRPVAIGDVLPGDLPLTDDEGNPRTVAQLTEDETVLVFWRVDCMYCAAIAADVAELSSSVQLALVTGSPTEAVRASGLDSRLIREKSGALTAALQVPGTPSAVAVKAGVVTSEVAQGGPDVLALLARHAREPSPVS